MRSLAATLRGLGRALASPRVVGALWIVNLAIALPAAVWLGEAIRRSVSHRLVADELRRGFDFAWYGEWLHNGGALVKSFDPTQLGVGAFLQNLDRWLGLEIFQAAPGLIALGLAFSLAWLFMLGGVLEHFVRPVPSLTLARFLGDGARYFAPFLRLAILSAPLYWGIHRLSRWLFPWIEGRVRDVTVERTVLVAYLAGAALVALLAVLVKLVFDYAKISMAVEERRSALVAVVKGALFVLSHPLRTLGVVFWIGLLSVVALAAYAAVAPGAGVSTPQALIGAVLVSQAFLVVRLILRLAWVGGEVALYQESLRRLPPPL